MARPNRHRTWGDPRSTSKPQPTGLRPNALRTLPRVSMGGLPPSSKPKSDGRQGYRARARADAATGGRGGVDHTVTNEHYRQHQRAADSARRATGVANAKDTPAAHTRAAALHGKAIGTARAVGNHHAEDYHTHQAQQHSAKAVQLGSQHSVSQPASEKFQNTGRMKPGMSQAIQQNMAAKSSSVPSRQRAAGELFGHSNNAPDRFGVTEHHRQLAAQTKANAEAARSKGGSDASNHAMQKTAVANAKPSLASHSSAAKAHTQAASTHADLADKARNAGLTEQAKQHEYQAASHVNRAQGHRLEAVAHSRRIIALRKIGPGQRHGPDGKFT